MDTNTKKEIEKMKKGIFILAALFAISCGKKGNTNGSSDQNQGAENVQAPQLPEKTESQKTIEYLQDISKGFNGSDSYGRGLSCSYYPEINKFVHCQYDIPNSGNRDVGINIFSNDTFRIDKLSIIDIRECRPYPDCSENFKGTCKQIVKEYPSDVCNLYGIESGEIRFIRNSNISSLILESKISNYKFAFIRY
jgi:hypothetical protein